MKKRVLTALMSGDQIVYVLYCFILKRTARFERVYPDGRIEAPDENDMSVLSQHFHKKFFS